MSDYFRIDGLHIHYGKALAVNNLSLSMAEGETLALLGPSGCGKTTTMRAIAGLLQPTSGSLWLEGCNITNLPANKREVGLVFQSYALFPHLNVFDNVAFGLRLRSVKAADCEMRVREALRMVGLADFAQRLPRELSGGQQQRVALARTVAVRPRLLLLDEPLSNLDTRLRLEMRSELKQLQRQLNITMVVVTHDQLEALALADRVAVMRDGALAQLGTPQAVYERPATRVVAAFMGMDNIIERSSGKLPAAAFGQFAALAWRPQAVRLGAGSGDSSCTGTVAGASYLGDAMELLIDSPLGRIKAQTHSHAAYKAGDLVQFELPLSQAVGLNA